MQPRALVQAHRRPFRFRNRARNELVHNHRHADEGVAAGEHCVHVRADAFRAVDVDRRRVGMQRLTLGLALHASDIKP